VIGFISRFKRATLAAEMIEDENISKTFYFESKESFNAFKKALMRN
jgi:hypothetical protein